MPKSKKQLRAEADAIRGRVIVNDPSWPRSNAVMPVVFYHKQWEVWRTDMVIQITRWPDGALRFFGYAGVHPFAYNLHIDGVAVPEFKNDAGRQPVPEASAAPGESITIDFPCSCWWGKPDGVL